MCNVKRRYLTQKIHLNKESKVMNCKRFLLHMLAQYAQK